MSWCDFSWMELSWDEWVVLSELRWVEIRWGKVWADLSQMSFCELHSTWSHPHNSNQLISAHLTSPDLNSVNSTQWVSCQSQWAQLRLRLLKWAHSASWDELIWVDELISVEWSTPFNSNQLISTHTTQINSFQLTLVTWSQLSWDEWVVLSEWATNSTLISNSLISTQLHSTQISSSQLTQLNSPYSISTHLTQHNSLISTQLHSTQLISTHTTQLNSTQLTLYLTWSQLNSTRLTQHNSLISTQLHSAQITSLRSGEVRWVQLSFVSWDELMWFQLNGVELGWVSCVEWVELSWDQVRLGE